MDKIIQTYKSTLINNQKHKDNIVSLHIDL